jgi:hypothetical protein
MDHARQFLDWAKNRDATSGNVVAESCNIVIAVEDTNLHQDENMQQAPTAWDPRYISIWSTEGMLDVNGSLLQNLIYLQYQYRHGHSINVIHHIFCRKMQSL